MIAKPQRYCAAFIGACLLLACRWAASADISDARLEIHSAVGGLDRPTAMEFLGPKNNDLFVLEKNSGQVKRFAPTGSSVVLDLPVDSASHHGLLGLALDPSFATNGYQSVEKSPPGIFQPRRSQNNDLRRCLGIASMRCRSRLSTSTGCFADLPVAKMPEGLEKVLQPRDLVDLIAFLRQPVKPENP